MKTFAAALVCLILSLLVFIPETGMPVPASVLEAAEYIIPLLLIYIMAEALLVRRELRETDQVVEKLAEEELPRISGAERRELQREYDELLEEKEALQTAFKEAQTRLKEAQALPGTALRRDAQIDAEVVNLIALLQEKGRLVDFVMDDITSYPDAQVGAAARVVHQGCAGVLREYFEIAPVHTGREDTAIELNADYDPSRYRLVGKVGGAAPFRGVLLHHGWIVKAISLPRVVKTGESLEQHRVIAPAEVELA